MTSAIIRSMFTTDDNHGAQTQFHSGRHMLDGEYPTLGAWVHYGLGSLNDNLPQFISIGKREYWNAKDGHYLGPAHDAMPIRVDPANPLDFGKPANGQSLDEQQIGFDLVGQLNRLKGVEYPDDPALNARIKAYELAFRMQTSVPDILNLNAETKETQDLYGLDDPATRDFGMQMLASRRFVEQGVRFIQVQHGAGGAGAWDALRALKANHTDNFKAVDRPIAGLLEDLKRRGDIARFDNRAVCQRIRPNARISRFGWPRSPYLRFLGLDGRRWNSRRSGPRLHRRNRIPRGREPSLRHRYSCNDSCVQMGLDSRRLEVPGRKRLDIDHGKPIHEILG